MKKTNKLICIMLALAMLMSMASLTVLAAEDDVPEGTVAAVLLPDGTTEYYTNLQTAINAAAGSSEGATVKLIENITLDDGKYIDIYDADGLLILDLNGKVLTGNTSRISFITGAGTIRVRYSDVKITDSGSGGAIINNNTEEFSTAIGNLAGSALEIEKGTVRGEYSGISPKAQEFSQIIVSGGSVEGKHYGIYTQQTNSLKVTGGSISSEQYAVCSLGKVEITNGTFTGSYALLDGYQNDVSVSGGTFCGSIRDSDNNLPAFLAEGCVFIQNGSELDSSGSDTLSASQSNPITVIRKYAASVTALGAEPVYYVNFTEAVTAASASEGSTLKLLDDVALTDMLEIDSGKFTIELNGKTISNGIEVGSDAELTITDNDSSGMISADTFGIINNGSLIIKGGTINASCAVYSYGTVTVDGGNIQGYLTNNGALIVNNGTLTRIKNPNTSLEATVEINGGTFTDLNTIENNDGDITVKGGIYPNGFSVTNDGNIEYTVNSILADDYYYKDADGKIITAADNATSISGYVKVSKGADLEDAVITLSQTEYEYSGSENKPAVTVTIGGKTLTENTDYTVDYADNINAGLATVTVTAVADSDYSGEAAKEFRITPRAVTISGVTIEGTKTYDGNTNAVITGYGTVQDVINGDNVTVDTTNAKATYADKNVGEDITVAFSGFALTGEDAANYELTAQPEATTADIEQKSVTATATAPDKVYDGTVGVDLSKVEITFEGIVDGETVEYEVLGGAFFDSNVGNKKKVGISYDVSGETVDNYDFRGDYLYAPEADYFVKAAANITEKGMANAQITLGEALTYTGNEQTQTVAGVTVDGLTVTYDISGNKATNVGVYELTVKGNGNFTGTATALYEIAPDTTPIDDLTVDNVKSTDKADIEAVKATIENAVTDIADDETKAEYKAIADKCDELLKKIADTAEEIDRINEAVNGYDEETVKSSDTEAIEQLKEDIQALIDSGNVTEEEIKALEETKADADVLTDKIDETQAEIERINNAVDSYSEDTVKSTDKEAVEQLKEDIQTLIDSGNVTEEEIKALEETKDKADALIDKIADTEEQLDKIGEIENGYDPEKVTSDDKAAIEEIIAEIEAVNPDNLTDEQKAEYEQIKADLEALLEKIEATEKEVSDIGVELEMFDENRVTIFWEDDIEALKAKIDALLADENMGEAEIAKLNEYKAQADNLIEIINDPCKYFSCRFFFFIWDCLNWKWGGLQYIFFLILGC